MLLDGGCIAEQGEAAGTLDLAMWLWWRRCIAGKGTASVEERRRHGGERDRERERCEASEARERQQHDAVFSSSSPACTLWGQV
jgi:hypothetical protein